MSGLKIAVYAIAKNEAKHARRFVESVREADEIVVLDTGSTDGTDDILTSLGGVVVARADFDSGYFAPFRFDRARNVALNQVGDYIDVCVSMDLDEVASPGWRQAIEEAWTPDVTRLRYLFAWSHHADGTNDIAFYADKIHARHGYHWEYPVHEFLKADDPAKEVFAQCAMEVHHWPDASKSRSSYLPLLALSARERPDDQRAALYYGRELMYYGRHKESIAELERYLKLPEARWHVERSAAMRFIARGYKALGASALAELWFWEAAQESPSDREALVELANLYWDQDRFSFALRVISNALQITERPKHYLTEAFAWGDWPERMATSCREIIKHFPETTSV